MNKSELQKKYLELFQTLPTNIKVSAIFCTECGEVVYPSEVDKCEDCNYIIEPNLDLCPECDSSNLIPLCSNCGKELLPDYVSDILNADTGALNYISISDLKTIKKWIKKTKPK